MRGIILAGGQGSRLYPASAAVSKQLIPVYDKPLIYYPLSTLMLAGIREILIIAVPRDLALFQHLFGDGRALGVSIEYATQPRPEGVAQALVIGAEFTRQAPAALILGDNIFYGQGLPDLLQRCARLTGGGIVFGYRVTDPHRYGVAELDGSHRILSIEEKPTSPRSSCAITGLYFYDGEAADIARTVRRSTRGEFEITDVNREYLRRGTLQLELLGRGIAWLDTGTPEAMLDAAHFVQVIERRQGLKVSCIEEIAFRMGFIDAAGLERLASAAGTSDYGLYLRRLIAGS